MPVKFKVVEYDAHVPPAAKDKSTHGGHDIHVEAGPSFRYGRNFNLKEITVWNWRIYGLTTKGHLAPGESWHSSDTYKPLIDGEVNDGDERAAGNDDENEILLFGQDTFPSAAKAQAAALKALDKIRTELMPKTCKCCGGTGRQALHTVK